VLGYHGKMNETVKKGIFGPLPQKEKKIKVCGAIVLREQ
jgi:hypothetical protein